MPYSFRNRLPWGILFALLGAASIWAMSKIPYTHLTHGFDCVLNEGGESLNVEHAWYRGRARDDPFWGWIQHFDFDLTTGAIDPWSQPQSIRQMTLFGRPPRRKVDERKLTAFQYSTVQTALSYVSSGSGFALVADRYIVGHSYGKIRSVDLGDPKLTRREIDAPSQTGCPYQIPGSRNFVNCPAAPLLGTSPSKSPIRLDLIRINDDGNLEFLATWSAHWSSVGLKSSVAIGDEIASLSNSGTAIEFRSIDDARLLHTLELPESFDATKHPWHFGWNYFGKNRGNLEGLVIDLQRKQKLPPPPETTFQLWPGGDVTSPLLNYDDLQRRHGVLVDRTTGQRIMDYVYDSLERPIVLDERRLLFPDRAYGFSARIVEIPSGRLIRNLVPLWWVTWFVGLWVIAYLITAIGWMRASAADGGWAFLDIVVVGGLAVLLLSIRLGTGESFDSHRSPHLVINGICAAGVMLPVIWLVLGKPPLILRGLPLLLAFSFVLAVRYAVWGDRPSQVWHSTMPIVVSMGCAFLICLVASLFRIEFVRPSSTDVGPDQCEITVREVRSFHLRHLLLTIACIGVFLATIRPLLPSIASIADMEWLELRTIYATCVMLILAAAIMSSRRWIVFCAAALALTAATAIVSCDLSSFAQGQTLAWFCTYYVMPFGYSANAAFSGVALFLIPYRLRGWRIRRRNLTARISVS